MIVQLVINRHIAFRDATVLETWFGLLSSTEMRQLRTGAALQNSLVYPASFYAELFSCQAQGVDITRTQITKK